MSNKSLKNGVEMNYLIVGGTSGIGKAIVDKLTDESNTLYVMARSKPHGEFDDNINFIQHDVLDDSLNPEWLPDHIDGLVYCPGSINLRPFQSLKVENYTDDFQINVIGAVNVLKAALPRLKKSDAASVVLFSTVAVQTGMTYHASIAAAKGAVEGLTRSLAAEWAPIIRVNAIAPSLTDTPLAEQLLNNEQKQKSSAERHPLKRYGQADDIANMALFLLSEKSSWMTGQIVHVDGGLSSVKKL